MKDLAAAGVEVWLDGGWCVDALVGRQLREHDDIDLAVPRAQESRLVAWLDEAGYARVTSPDESPWNYVVENSQGHRLDIHVFEHDEHGQIAYGVAYPLESLTGTASLGSVRVNCIDPEWQFRFKTGYPPREKDLIDVAAMADKYGLSVPQSHRVAHTQSLDSWPADPRSHRPAPGRVDGVDAAVIPFRQVRADFDDDTVVVYQAFSPAIADPAVRAGRFVPPFGMSRMTWIKPSFLWMMYRCGWATKPGQERVLAVRITRAGFEAALADAALSAFEPGTYPDIDAWRAALRDRPVRVQWDPERTPDGSPLAWRSLQVGLSGDMVTRYVNEWTVAIKDITPTLTSRRNGDMPLPVERAYPLPDEIARRIGAS